MLPALPLAPSQRSDCFSAARCRLLCRSSAISKLSQRFTARGMGAGMGGGGHANIPTFMWQSDFQKNKWKAGVFVGLVVGLGTYVPYKCVHFAQKKAGVW